jgi:hypothetical protein
MEENNLITGDSELAKRLGLTTTRVRSWRKSGILPHRKLGRNIFLYWWSEVLETLRSKAGSEAKPEATQATEAAAPAPSAQA